MRNKSTARSYSILPNGNPIEFFELCTITDFYFLSTEVRNFRDPRLFNICGRFQHEHVVHLLAAHIFGVEAVVGFDEEAAHGDEGGFGEVEFRAAVFLIRRVGAIQCRIELIRKVGRHFSSSPVAVDMSHVLVDDIVAGAAEVGACLAVDVVDADGEGLRLENIRFAVVNAVVVAVRTFIVQRKLSEVLDEFALNAEHRGDIVGAGEAVGFRDMTDRAAGFHAVSVNFPLARPYAHYPSGSS